MSMIDLRLGDSIELSKELEDNSIDCTVTSPPYNKCGVGGGLFRKIEYAAFDDPIPEDKYQDHQIELLNLLFDKTKPVGSFFYNHKVRYFKGNAISPWQWLTRTKWHIREEIVWNRGSGPEISGYRFIQIDERVYWLCKGEKHPRLPRRSANYGTEWKFGHEMSNPHPAPYPIKLPLRCIQGIMQEKGVILDPYSGSGTTGLAAKLLGHDYIGFDLSDEYHDMARKRFDNPSKNDLKKFTEECGIEVKSDTDVFNLAGA